MEKQRNHLPNIFSKTPLMADSKPNHGGLFVRVRLKWYPVVINYIYAYLFMYTGVDKIRNISHFIKGNQKIPLAGQFAELISWSIPILEILLAISLILPLKALNFYALKFSVALMAMFTFYLALMLLFADQRLCHCGGVLETMTWTQHLAFNIAFLVAGILSIKLFYTSKSTRNEKHFF